MAKLYHFSQPQPEGCFSFLFQVVWKLMFGLSCITTLPMSGQRCLYVSDGGNFNLPPWQILRFDADGTNGTVFIDDHLAWPQDILFLDAEESVLISNLNSGAISRFHSTTGEYIDEFATGIGGPTRMKIGPDGLLYVLQWSGNGKVWRYQLNGSFVDEFTATGVISAIGLDWDAQGNLYVSSYYGDRVRKFSPTGEDLGIFIATGLQGPTNIWFDENGDLFVIDYDGGAVKRFNSNGELVETFITDLPQGEGVDFTPEGNIVVGCGGTGSVRVYGSDGMYIEDLVPPGTLDLILPNAVVFHDKTTSAITSTLLFHEITIATPTVGHIFRIEHIDSKHDSTQVDVTDVNGRNVKAVESAEGTIWNASDLTDGVYFLTVKLNDGSFARQQIVVQK